MAQSKITLNSENLNEWLASTGFLFPRNEVELKRFETLYKEGDEDLSDMNVDIQRILKGTPRLIPATHRISVVPQEELRQYRMVARKGSTIPSHILEKMKRNQEKGNRDDTDSPEK